MYISLSDLLLGILWGLGVIALIVLIIALIKLIKFLGNLNSLISDNKKNLDELCSSLPTISENAVQISDNIKDVSEVITETTADVIVARENISGSIEIVRDIANIVGNVFGKK